MNTPDPLTVAHNLETGRFRLEHDDLLCMFADRLKPGRIVIPHTQGEVVTKPSSART